MLAPCGRALLSALVAFFIYADVGSVGAAGLEPQSPRIYIYPMPDSYREYAPAAFVSMYRYPHALGWKGAGRACQHAPARHDYRYISTSLRCVCSNLNHQSALTIEQTVTEAPAALPLANNVHARIARLRGGVPWPLPPSVICHVDDCSHAASRSASPR